MRYPARIGAAWLLAAFALLSGRAIAGSFQVEPLKLSFERSAEIQAIRVRNTGLEPLVLQVTPVAWRQSDGQDQYEATRALLATPPMITVMPDAEQIVRVALREPPLPNEERAFRLYFHEVPAAPGNGFQGLQVALRVGIPVFVTPASGAVSATPVWQAQRMADGKVRLSLRNTGRGHLRIHQLAVENESGVRLFEHGLTYVLPGQERAWTFDAKQARRLRVQWPSDVSRQPIELAIEGP